MNIFPQIISNLIREVSRVIQREYQQNYKKYNDQIKEIKEIVEELNQLQMADLDAQIYNQQEKAQIYKGKEAMATNRELLERLPKPSNVLDEFISIQSDIYQELLKEIEKNLTILKELKKMIEQKMLMGNTQYFGQAQEKIKLNIVLELVAPSQITAIFDKNPEFLEKKYKRIVQLKSDQKMTVFTFCRQDFGRLQQVDKQYSQILLTLSSDRHCSLQAKRNNQQVDLYLIVNGRNSILVKRNSTTLKISKGDEEFKLQQLDKIVLLQSDQNDLISYKLTHLHQQLQ